MDISNKTLSLFLLLAILISMVSTVESLSRLRSIHGVTGHVTTSPTFGNTTLNVQTQASIIFVYNLVDFGQGYVNSSGLNCTLVINNSNAITATGCVGFNTTTSRGDTFIIMNNGNTYLNVTLNSSANATNFIGGTTTVAQFQYVVTNNETGSCVAGAIMPYNGTWYSPSINDSPTVCGNLSYVLGSRTLRMGLRLVIPANAVQGARIATFIVTGTQ